MATQQQKEQQTIPPGAVWHNGAFESAPAQRGYEASEQRREEIITYIKGRLGADLASVYDAAIRSSVDTGSYDNEWVQEVHPKIERYLQVLRQDWMHKQGDAAPLVARIHHILNFGTDVEKTQLKKLLHLS